MFLFQYSHISMLAAGTGIAPMLQIIRKVLDNENDETRLLLIYSCKRSCDILMKGLLDEFKSFWNFQVIYCITRKVTKFLDCQFSQFIIHYIWHDSQHLLRQAFHRALAEICLKSSGNDKCSFFSISIIHS